MCRASHDKQVVWLTDKNYLNSVRQTLAASVIFIFFVCFFLSGGGRRILQETDHLETTHMLEYLVIPSDLVLVTTHLRTEGMPHQWRVVLFPDQCCPHHPVNVHGLFPLVAQAAQGSVVGRGGRVSVLFLLGYYYVYKFLKLIIILNLKNVMPVPPLSHSRSGKQHYH